MNTILNQIYEEYKYLLDEVTTLELLNDYCCSTKEANNRKKEYGVCLRYFTELLKNINPDWRPPNV